MGGISQEESICNRCRIRTRRPTWKQATYEEIRGYYKECPRLTMGGVRGIMELNLAVRASDGTARM